MNYTKEQILEEMENRYNEIDDIITDIVRDGLNGIHRDYGSRMSAKLICIQQDLTVFHDFVKEK